METRESMLYDNLLDAAKKARVNKELNFDCTMPENELLLFLAKELAKEAAPNPIHEGEPGYNEYNDMLFFLDTWPEGKPTCAFKKRFLLAAYDLCRLCPQNIFTKGNEDVETVSLDKLKEQEYAETEAEDIETETYVPVEETVTMPEGEKQHVFGVVPFDDGGQRDLADYYAEQQEEKKPAPVYHGKKRRRR